MNTREDFFRNVRKTATCWLWIAAKTDCGYGQLRWRGEHRLAHHVSWELHKGPIPKGKHILHKDCDVKHCIRPKHLYSGTRRNNGHDFMKRQWHKHNTRKLTPTDVRRIRRLNKTMTYAQIARLYPHVEYKAIRRAAQREYWKSVE